MSMLVSAKLKQRSYLRWHRAGAVSFTFGEMSAYKNPKRQDSREDPGYYPNTCLEGYPVMVRNHRL